MREQEVYMNKRQAVSQPDLQNDTLRNSQTTEVAERLGASPAVCNTTPPLLNVGDLLILKCFSI